VEVQFEAGGDEDSDLVRGRRQPRMGDANEDLDDCKPQEQIE